MKELVDSVESFIGDLSGLKVIEVLDAMMEVYLIYLVKKDVKPLG